MIGRCLAETKLEHRLDQADKFGFRSETQHLHLSKCVAQRDIRNVCGHEIDLFRHLLPIEVGHVGGFEIHHTSVLAEGAEKLPVAGVDRVHTTSSAIEELLRKPPGRRADVEARPVLNYDIERIEGGTQLLDTTKLLLVDDDDRGTAFDTRVGVSDNAPVNANAARVYRGPRIA